MSTPQYEFLAKRFDERFDDLKSEMTEIKAQLLVMQSGYVRNKDLELRLEPLQSKVTFLEKIIYWGIGFVLLSVLGALIALVVNSQWLVG